MSDILYRLQDTLFRFGKENPNDAANRRIYTAKDAADEIKKLREALHIYALPSNWRVDGTFLAPSPQSEYRPDCGEIARAALALAVLT